MLTPTPRGPLSEAVVSRLRSGAAVGPVDVDTATDDDLHLALWVAYELHFRGFDDADDAMEWDADLIGLRGRMERRFEAELRSRAPQTTPDAVDDVGGALFDLVEHDEGASLADRVRTDATRDQVVRLLEMRSVYHLKESDPVSFVIPRLSTVPKAALMELQFDEYGGGDPRRLHHHLFALGMEASGMDPKYGAHVDSAPAEALAANNAMSLFGLHRRLRGAALGHLAAFEATSSLPSRKMVQGLERLGFPDAMTTYYREHIEADAVHEQLAARTICGALVDEEPEIAGDVMLGAFTCLDLEDRFARRTLEEWAA